MPSLMQLKQREWERCKSDPICSAQSQPPPPLGNINCINGKADEYECSNIDLLSFLPRRVLGCRRSANDIWGWTDPETRREYAIVGCDTGTSFVDVTRPQLPRVLGFLPTHSYHSHWRDIKVSSYLTLTKEVPVAITF